MATFDHHSWAPDIAYICTTRFSIISLHIHQILKYLHACVLFMLLTSTVHNTDFFKAVIKSLFLLYLQFTKKVIKVKCPYFVWTDSWKCFILDILDWFGNHKNMKSWSRAATFNLFTQNYQFHAIKDLFPDFDNIFLSHQ